MRNYQLIFLCLLSWVFTPSLLAQKQNYNWHFGLQGRLDFNTAPPSIPERSASAATYPDYSSAISDSNGVLQFYTDGKRFWDKSHRKMRQLKAGRLWWAEADKIRPLIVPNPGNPNQYYVFLTHKTPDIDNSFFYVTVDMTGNSGNGIMEYQPEDANPPENYLELLDKSSIFLAATQHCNRKDFWVVTHKGNNFLSYLVTATGVSKTPVSTTISPSLFPAGRYTDSLNIKFSASGEKMLVPLQHQNAIIIFDFDTKTGLFSNPIKINITAGGLWEAELSPNGSKLYYDVAVSIPVSDDFTATGHMLYQMDLSVGPDPSAIIATNTPLLPFPDRNSQPQRGPPNEVLRTMQLAPDGKIYVSKRTLDYTLNLIEDPDRAGTNCRYIRNGFNAQVLYNNINFNYIRSISFVNEKNSIQTQKGVCGKQPVEFSLVLNKVDSVKWDFGDPQSGNNNYSRQLQPKHIFTNEATYTVTAIIFTNCFTDTATTTVTVEPDQPLNPTFEPRDSAFCEGGELIADVTTTNATNYIWSDGTYDTVKHIKEDGNYTVTIRNKCYIKSYDFTVDVKKCPCNVYMPNAFTPNGDGRNDYFRPGVNCALSDYTIQIFNRYGNKVFESHTAENGWNGKFKNSDQPQGIYAWIISYYNPDIKKTIREKGSFILLR